MMCRFRLCVAMLLIMVGMVSIVGAQLKPEAGLRPPSKIPPSVGQSIGTTNEWTRLPPVEKVQLAQAVDEPDRTAGETLEQAWATALAVDRKLRAQGREVSSAEQTLLQANAERHPVLALDSSYTVRDNEPAFQFDLAGLPLSTRVFPYIQSEDFAFRSTVDVPLYTSGRIEYGIDAAEASLNSAELNATIFKSDLKLRVAEEFVAVLRTQRDVEVARSIATSLGAHLRDVKMLFEHQRVRFGSIK